MYCSHCGAYVPTTSNVCLSCGAECRADTTKNNPPTAKNKYESRLQIIEDQYEDATRSNFELPIDTVRVKYKDRILSGALRLQNRKSQIAQRSDGRTARKEIFTLTFETGYTVDEDPFEESFCRAPNLPQSYIIAPVASAAFTGYQLNNVQVALNDMITWPTTITN